MIGLFSVLDIPSVRIITGSKHDDEAGGTGRELCTPSSSAVHFPRVPDLTPSVAGSMGLAGALCVIGSCLCMSLYYILQKPLLAKVLFLTTNLLLTPDRSIPMAQYSVLSLTAWSYLFGALWMGLGAAIMALGGVCFKEKKERRTAPIPDSRPLPPAMKDADAAMGCVAHPAAWTINQETGPK